MPATKATYAASLLIRASGGLHIMQVTRYRAGAAMGPHESYEVGIDPNREYPSAAFLGGHSAYNIRRAAVWREVEQVAELMAPRGE